MKNGIVSRHQRYINVILVLFLVFISGVLCFGRLFSLLHINIYGFKVFITELFLLISLPLILLRGRSLLNLPVRIRIPVVIFFFLGFLHFLIGILGHNLFALRDIVLWGYLLFLPLTFILCSDKETFIALVIILIETNFINLSAGGLILYSGYSSLNFDFLTRELRPFNLGLYYGISLSFLVSFFPAVSKNKLKLLMSLLIAMNICMLLVFSIRTLWFALLSLSAFFIFMQPRLFVRNFLKASLVLIPVLVLLSFLANKGIGAQKEFLISKFKTISIIASDSPERSRIVAKDNLKSGSRTNDEVSFSNLVWRSEVWKQSINFGLKSPLFGRGFGVYPDYLIYHDPYHKATSIRYVLQAPKRIDIDSGVTPAHDHIITIFFKMGLIGLALFMFINIYTFWYGIRYMHKVKDAFLRCFLIGSLGAFVFWHSMALFFDVIDSPPTSIFLWIIIGLIFAVVEIDKKSNSSAP